MAVTTGLEALARTRHRPPPRPRPPRASSGRDGCLVIGGALTPGQAGYPEPPGPQGAIRVCASPGGAVFWRPTVMTLPVPVTTRTPPARRGVLR
jgi:hypothetical protein